MKITEAVFIKSASGAEQCPADKLPEIAFCGRSNVGKSSMINSLLQRKGLARTSSTPGQTRLINFFLVNKSFYFVDLPGYGYAKVSMGMREDWKRMVDDYLVSRKKLRAVVLIVDLRRGLEPEEVDFLAWLKGQGMHALVAATKSDKLNQADKKKALAALSEQAGTPDLPVVMFSAHTGEGKEQLWGHLDRLLRAK